ncbi:MAG: alpha/beta fold hydrolase [Gemmatimonas sp.]|nr:alpha/beta fold hydrolase [Gemmatimonas sp.]
MMTRRSAIGYLAPLAGIWLAGCQGANADPDVIPAAASVDPGTRIEEARFLNVGGIDQWITIRGDDTRNPVLLVLHGGPGDVQSPHVDTYAAYERDFVLVQWDQRGAGKTYGRYREGIPPPTLDQLVTDAIELAEDLKDRFEGNGVVVLGHSWGTAIATGAVLRRPDLFSAYVGTGQISSWAESVRWQFDFLKARSEEMGDQELLRELEAIGEPDPTDTAQYFGFTRSLRQHFNASDSAWLARLRDLPAGLVSAAELEDIENGMMFSGRALLPFQVRENLSTVALTFEVPYYVIQGRDDISTPTRPAVAYFERISAPDKEIVIIDDAGHFALVTHQEQFIEALRRLLPS